MFIEAVTQLYNPYTASFVFTIVSILSVFALVDIYTTGYMLKIITIIMLLLFTHLRVFLCPKKLYYLALYYQ